MTDCKFEYLVTGYLLHSHYYDSMVTEYKYINWNITYNSTFQAVELKKPNNDIAILKR
jgi:hypothetical protein